MAQMKGTDRQFTDFPDYILRVTREIWEDRNIASLRKHYSSGIIVRSPAGIATGNEAVIAQTMATLAEFPDRQLLGEDVIWSGSPERGMLSSHRILSTATHLGEGSFGAPTGTRLRYRIIADCHARDDRIDDEWLIRDLGAIVRQLGHTPKDFAAAQIEQEGGVENCHRPLTPASDIAGPYRGRGNDNEWGQRLAGILQAIVGADLAVIPREYDRAVQVELPGGVTRHSHGAVDGFWVALRAALPGADFVIHHQIGREDPLMPPRAAIRWSLTGAHDGPGMFGAPTGAQLHVMGMTHAEFGHRGVRREFTLFDEVAVWKQILLASGG